MIHPIVISRYGKTGEYRIPRSDRYIYVPLEVPITNKLWTEWTEHYMATKTTTSDPSTNTSTTAGSSPEDFKDTNLKYNLSKFEYDLYHEEDDIAEKVIRVKRVPMPNKQEKWKIFEDGKVALVVEGAKLNNKEKDFLRSVDGVNFLIRKYKDGIKSFNALKNEIKKVLK
jgi:hypothetical protein